MGLNGNRVRRNIVSFYIRKHESNANINLYHFRHCAEWTTDRPINALCVVFRCIKRQIKWKKHLTP